MTEKPVDREIRMALNVLHTNGFKKSAEGILRVANSSICERDGRTLRQVTGLIFEHAVADEHWAHLFATLCKFLYQRLSSRITDSSIENNRGYLSRGGILFREYVLQLCQVELENGSRAVAEEVNKTRAGVCVAAAGKKRNLNIIAFIAQLYHLGVFTKAVLEEFISTLLKVNGAPPYDNVEQLATLVQVTGGVTNLRVKEMYFRRVSSMIEDPEVDNDIRLLLMKLVEISSVTMEAFLSKKTARKLRNEALKAEEQRFARTAGDTETAKESRFKSQGRMSLAAFFKQAGGEDERIGAPNIVSFHEATEVGQTTQSRLTYRDLVKRDVRDKETAAPGVGGFRETTELGQPSQSRLSPRDLVKPDVAEDTEKDAPDADGLPAATEVGPMSPNSSHANLDDRKLEISRIVVEFRWATVVGPTSVGHLSPTDFIKQDERQQPQPPKNNAPYGASEHRFRSHNRMSLANFLKKTELEQQSDDEPDLSISENGNRSGGSC